MPYLIAAKSARPPPKKYGDYWRIAVLEVDDEVTKVTAISIAALGVRRIVQVWCDLATHTHSKREEYQRAYAEAKALLARLRDEPPREREFFLARDIRQRGWSRNDIARHLPEPDAIIEGHRLYRCRRVITLERGVMAPKLVMKQLQRE